ncbi:hypothetical protein ACHAXS_005599 [Conticribra weissflogii]
MVAPDWIQGIGLVLISETGSRVGVDVGLRSGSGTWPTGHDDDKNDDEGRNDGGNDALPPFARTNTNQFCKSALSPDKLAHPLTLNNTNPDTATHLNVGSHTASS